MRGQAPGCQGPAVKANLAARGTVKDPAATPVSAADFRVGRHKQSGNPAWRTAFLEREGPTLAHLGDRPVCFRATGNDLAAALELREFRAGTPRAVRGRPVPKDISLAEQDLAFLG